MGKKAQVSVAEYLDKAVDISGKTQREIAAEVGYAKPNVLSMMKQGQTKVPIGKIPAISKALGVDPVNFVRLAMTEYHPEVWDTLSDAFGEALSANERRLLDLYREASAKTGLEIEVSGEMILHLRETLGSGR
jgi:transcriptional regulator with XRE-family HTH domain